MEKDYEEDKELLIDFYNSKGFRNAHILSDSIYTINEKRLGIHIKLEEGNKYYIRNVSWVGNSRYDTEYLQKLLSVKSGDVYDKKSIHKRLGIGKEMNPEEMSISSLYQNDGYLVSQIEPAEIVVGPDSLDLEVRVFEGKQFTINNVGISGNMRVDDEVIRRELYTRPAYADHPYPCRYAALQRGGYYAGHQARSGCSRSCRYQLASRGEGVRPI